MTDVDFLLKYVHYQDQKYHKKYSCETLLKKILQETLVHAPKLWAEEISMRALLFP